MVKSAAKPFFITTRSRTRYGPNTGERTLRGHLIGLINEEGKLKMVNHHINAAEKLKTGKCISTIEVLPSGKLRLHESWQWTCDDFSKGESVVEEV